MAYLVFLFRDEWIKMKGDSYREIRDELAQYIKMLDCVTTVSLSADAVEVQVKYDDREYLILAVGRYMKEQFDEPYPYRNISLIGDVQEMRYAERFQDEYEDESVEGMFRELEEKLDGIDKNEKENVAQQIEESKPQEKMDKESKNQVLDKVPVKYSPEMTEYINEVHRMIPMFRKMGIGESIFSHSILISIDEGWGYSKFLQAITREFYVCDAVLEECMGNEKEIIIDEPSDKEHYAEWLNHVNLIKEICKRNEKTQDTLIISFDIRKWLNELSDPTILECLRKMGQYSKNFICVFKVPYMEPQVLRKIEETLASVMPLRTIAVPPISVENMIDYIKDGLRELKCTPADDCDELYEQWISQERRDNNFFGYKTLDRMIKELIYKKALLNCEKGEPSHEIGKSEIEAMLYGPKVYEDPYKLLSDMIGIAQVKSKVREIVAQIKARDNMKEQGAELQKPCIHMVFSGNPGTGKTTVARILARILKEEGILRKGQFYEVQGRNLCGRYIGETAPKTSAYCRDAYGSVLFIDEAYGLYNDSERDYGKEAIQTLITEMENHRDDFCVIMAGYQDEMDKLMEMNPGLRSRIPYTIEFPNYTREELVEIFFAMMDGKLEYEEDLREALEKFFANISDAAMKTKNFSNARLVRNLFERVWGKAAYRSKMNGETTLRLQKEDLIGASEETDFKKLLEEKQYRRIGFM